MEATKHDSNNYDLGSTTKIKVYASLRLALKAVGPDLVQTNQVKRDWYRQIFSKQLMFISFINPHCRPSGCYGVVNAHAYVYEATSNLTYQLYVVQISH